MRLVFAGTPEFAKVALVQLVAAGFEVPLVLTQPDRPAGRGMKLQASPVKQWAQAQGIAVAQPAGLKLDGKYANEAAAAQAQILAAKADVIVVAAYGLILPIWALQAPRLGCLNIHASILPRWRGAAPIHRAIEAGDTETGVTIMQMDAGLDTGDMLLLEKLAIAADDSTASLHDKLAAMGGRLIVDALRLAASGSLQPVVQPEAGATYAAKIEKHEAQINWQDGAQLLARKSRAFDPFPGCVSSLELGAKPENIKLWRLEALPDDSAQPVGAIVALDAQSIVVSCGAVGQGRVRITQLQKAGGKRLNAQEFLAGTPLQIGMCWR